MCELVLHPVGGPLRVPATTACLGGNSRLTMVGLSTLWSCPQHTWVLKMAFAQTLMWRV